MASIESFNERRFSRTELAELAKKYWLLILVTFLSGTVGMWLSFSIFFTDLYESKTSLLVKIGRENADTPTTVQRGQVLSQGVRVTDTNSEVEMLSSRALVEAVVDRLGPDAFKSVLAPPQSWTKYPKYYVKKAARGVKNVYKEFLILADLKKRLTPREEAIVNVADGIKVEPVRDSDILVLKVGTPSAKLCVDVSNALLDVYLQQRAAARRMPVGFDFFAARLAEASDRLTKAEETRAAVRVRWNLTSALEQRTQYLTELSAIQAEMVRNDAEIAKLKRQRELMVSRLPELPELVRKEQVDAANPSIQSIKERVTALKLERAKLSSRYLPSSEVMRKIDAEIADVEAALRTEPSSILETVTAEENPSKRAFASGIEQQVIQIAGLETSNRALQEPASRLSERLKDLALGMDALEAAERQYHRAEQDYLAYSKRLEEARMSEALDAQRVTNVAVVAPPETPIAPVYPRKMFLMGIAMAVSLLLGLAAAALVETTEDRLLDERSVSELEEVTYLGTVGVRKVG
jgi:uncharacterized protein involved in exopolysaccharide biosynthesis